MPSVLIPIIASALSVLTIRSIGIKAMIAAALLAITVASRASVDEVTRWNQIATDATTVAKY